MLPDNQKMAVLFTDNFMGEEYHIMFLEQGQPFVIRTVLVTGRQGRAQNFEVLYYWMRKLHINRLWVHPDNLFSNWVMRSDFEMIMQTPDRHPMHWSSPKQEIDGHPKGLRMWVPGDVTRWIFFPAHIELVKPEHAHQKTLQMGQWITPSPDHLYNSVLYLERATDSPFLWGPAYSSKMMLRELHKGKKKIVPFKGETLFSHAYRKMVVRSVWIHRRIGDKQRGLHDRHKEGTWYIHGFDKNMQYLGACCDLVLPNEEYCVEVDPLAYDKKAVGFWEYEILDVSNSKFNSYDVYCPLDRKRNWASTQVIDFALRAGIELTIKRGLIFDREESDKYLDSWARCIWDARAQLRNENHYPDTIAAKNAIDSTKKYYIDMIGQFCNKYSDEYYHKDWNTFIVHNAITNQGFTILTRPELHDNMMLVVNDAFYVLSQEEDVYKAYPSLLKYQYELRGYKHIGSCVLNNDIHNILENEKLSPVDVEMKIKEMMRAKK
jgi:hypothetical protein